MATLVLGGLGAAAGSLVPGLGWRMGWAIGAEIGSIIDANAAQGVLNDRTISGSSWGTNIPRMWGQARLGGNAIWWKTDSKGNGLFKKSSGVFGGSGGGAKGGSQAQYTTTIAYAFCAGSLFLPDRTNPYGGEIVHQALTLQKLWADDQLVYDAQATGAKMPLTLGSNLFWHDGADSSSNQDSVIAAAEDAQTCAYPGLAYIVLTDFNVTPYGNTPPQMTALISGSADLSDFFYQAARLSGLQASEIDVTGVTENLYGNGNAWGIVQGQQQSGQDLLSPATTVFQYDTPVIDGKLTFIKRGGSSIVSIPQGDLGASSGEKVDRLKRTLAMEMELSGRVDVRYYDSTTDLQSAVQSDSRQLADIQNYVTVDLPMCLDPDSARLIAAQQNDLLWIEAQGVEFQLGPEYLYLTPGDPVIVATPEGNVRFRLTEMGYTPLGEIKAKAVLDNTAVHTQASPGGSNPGSPIGATVAVPTVFDAWSGKELKDSDQSSAGFYVVATGDSGWLGCTVYFSIDGGTTYNEGPAINTPGIFGLTTSALANGTTPDAFDTTNTVGVDVSESFGTLSNATDSQITGTGTNGSVVGAELLAFGTATLTGTGLYTLSNLYRGARGSTMTGHSSGERFVVATDAIARISVSSSLIGATVLVKCVSPYEDITDVTAVSVVIAAPTTSATAALIAQLTARTDLAETLLASYAPSGTGTRTPVSWTTIDLSSYIPVGATHVELYLEANDIGNDAGTQAIMLRSDSSGNTYTGCAGEIYIDDADLHFANRVIIPCSSSRSIDYEVLVGFENGWSISIVAYFAPPS